MARYNSYGIDEQHSSYWMGDIFRRSAKRNVLSDTDAEPTRTDDIEEALRLITLKRSVANFVSIVTGQSIPVVFSAGKQSYTNGKSVVLSAGNDGDFDSLVGTALHEGAHIIQSDFEFLSLYMRNSQWITPASLNKVFEDKFEDRGQYALANLVKMLFNIIEDRRIDYYIYREAPGYRPYYEAMYDRYWRSKQIDYAMRDKMMTIPTVDNYLFHLTNIANRYFDTRSLPELDLIYGLIDLDDLNRFDNDSRYDNAKKWFIHAPTSTMMPADIIPGMWVLLFKIAEIILTQSDVWEIEIEPPVGPGKPCEDGDESEEGGDDEDDGVGSDSDDEDEEGDGPSRGKEDGAPEENENGLDNLDAEMPDDGTESEDSEGESGDESDPAEDGDESESGSEPGDDESESDEDGDESEGDDPEKGSELSSGTELTETPESEGKIGEDSETPVNTSGYEFEVKSKERHAAADPQTRGKQGKVNESKLRKDIERQNEFADGGPKKKSIKKKVQNAVDAMESAGASIDEVTTDGFTAKVLILPSLTKEMLMTGASPFNYGTTWFWENAKGGTRGRYNYNTNSYGKPVPVTSKVNVTAPRESNLALQPQAVKGVASGMKMGKILAHKLAIRNQNNVQKFNRRPQGKIDKRRIANIGAGDGSIFYHLRKTEYEPVYLHLTIDASASMSGEKWEKSIALGAALGVAAHEIENLDIEVSIRAGVGAYAVIQTIYDSTVDTPAKIRSLWPYLTCPGTTPEGLCFEAISDRIIERARKRDGYFVNISDGCPWFGAGTGGSYSGDLAVKHTRGEVRKIEQAGVKILSYYVEARSHYYHNTFEVGRHMGTFRAMYGKAASGIDVTSVLSIARTLNKLFLS